jgi:hypothetical protein
MKLVNSEQSAAKTNSTFAQPRFTAQAGPHLAASCADLRTTTLILHAVFNREEILSMTSEVMRAQGVSPWSRR